MYTSFSLAKTFLGANHTRLRKIIRISKNNIIWDTRCTFILIFFSVLSDFNTQVRISVAESSRKNFVFLFGALINLTVRVDTYFHPMRMTYSIQPGPFFRTAPNWRKAAKHSLPQKLSNWTDVLLSAHLLLAAASRHHEESHLIYGPLEFILLDQGFPVDFELDEFNPPHTRTTLRRLQLWLCRLWRKIPLRHSATSSLGNIFWKYSYFSPQTTRTTHSWTTTMFLPLTSKHDFCNIYSDHISLTHSTMRHIQPSDAHFTQANCC